MRPWIGTALLVAAAAAGLAPGAAAAALAVAAAAATAQLSVFERALAQQQLHHAAGLLASDPLGIGVLLGYAALKTNEIANLRAIAQGLLLGEKPDRIRSELMLVD